MLHKYLTVNHRLMSTKRHWVTVNVVVPVVLANEIVLELLKPLLLNLETLTLYSSTDMSKRKIHTLLDKRELLRT